VEHRFGIARTIFDPYMLFRRKRSWSLLRRETHIHRTACLKVDRVGLKAFQQVGHYIKPTTRMIQVFGREATRGRVDLDRRALIRLLEGEVLPLDLDTEPGYVILGWMGNGILGLGLYVHGTLRSQIPIKELRRVHVP